MANQEEQKTIQGGITVDPITGCWDGTPLEKEWQLWAILRLVFTTYRGDIPEGYLVIHICPHGSNRLCVNPNHLALGSLTDINHAIK